MELDKVFQVFLIRIADSFPNSHEQYVALFFTFAKRIQCNYG